MASLSAAASGYGSGYLGYQRPRSGLGTLARAAGSTTNPFGLAGTTTFRPAAVAPINPDPTGGGQPTVTPPKPTPPPSTTPPSTTPPTSTPYDINTDPIYKQTASLLGQSDENATAGALAQRKNALLAYGDPELARKLGLGEDLAAAAAGNPTSTLAGLKSQRQQRVKDLTEALNGANLFYGGARIVQEQNAASEYQNALAQAAAAVSGALGQIDSNEAAVHHQNALDRLAALSGAYDRHKNDPGTDPTRTQPPGGGGGGGGGGGNNNGGGGGGNPPPGDNPHVPTYTDPNQNTMPPEDTGGFTTVNLTPVDTFLQQLAKAAAKKNPINLFG